MDFLILYGLIIISLLITLGAQAFISTCYSKYSKVSNYLNITGAEAARKILDKNGLSNVKVVSTDGYLSDHYDPKAKVVRLSNDNYEKASIAAVSVAAHECGHAIQDKVGYSFLRIRSSLVPFVNICSYAGYIAIVIGGIMGAFGLIWLGIGMEVVILLFQLITLPVEFNASKRGLEQIKSEALLNSSEYGSAKTMLTSAALTYVASVATTIIQILRLVLIYGRKR